MKKTDVIEFFDSLAENWDREAEKNTEKVNKILDFAGVGEGSVVLDVACGTGILIPDYLARGVKKCIAVDISPKMVEIAKKKYERYGNVEVICDDAETLKLVDKVDSIVVYNAFPHFADRERLFKNLSTLLKSGGRITVAHGMSRKALIAHHSGRAETVSTILPDIPEMKALMGEWICVDVAVSNDDLYVVSGKIK
ncbi:MAG: class I SAM-dependent methyltransferase [Oscillospiraceae bacterium]|nr:class I SAM-dependent methyltransferase [Oscillospiraceae bacterium]